MTNTYQDRITEQLRPHLLNPATRALTQQLIRSAVQYELAHRSGYTRVAAMELRRIERINQQLGFDPLA